MNQAWTQALRAQRVRREGLAAQAAPTAYPIADSPDKAPGHRFVGVEFSCVPDAMYPWDPDVLRAIWQFDSGAIPMWSRWIYRGLNDTSDRHNFIVLGRHMIGRHVENSSVALEPFQVLMPTTPPFGMKFKRPNVIESVPSAYLGVYPDSDLLGPFIPFGWDLHNFMRASYTQRKAKERFKRHWESVEREQERLDRVREAEEARRQKYMDGLTRKALERSSDQEILQYMMTGGANVN